MSARTLPIAGFWLVWFSGVGVIFPYYGLYLRENAGLGGGQVGIVLASLPLMGILAQPFWGQLADRSGLRARILGLLALGSSLGYAALYFADGFGELLLGTALLAFFTTAVVPIAVSVTLALVPGNDPHAFGRIRVWGTVGFLVLVVSFPLLAGNRDLVGASARGAVAEGPLPGLRLMFLVSGALSLIAAALSFRIPRGRALSLKAEPGAWRQLLSHPPFVRLMLFSFLAHACLHGPMFLFPIYVRSRGGDLTTVSQMWLLMLIVEIPLILWSGVALKRVGPRGLLEIGVFAGGVRWLVCALIESMPILFAVQLLHGIVVTGLLIGAPLYAEAVVPERLRSTGQGFLAMAAMSLGGIVSSLCAGWLLEHVGSEAPYLYGGLGAIALALLLRWFLPATTAPVARKPRS